MRRHRLDRGHRPRDRAQLLEEGATVVTSGRRDEGIGDLHVAADLAGPASPSGVDRGGARAFGRVDCLVNNVGWHEIRRFDELTDADWERSWQINVMSAVRATARGAARDARAEAPARS